MYECNNPDGTLWLLQRVRQTLAGYIIPWGLYREYYDEGGKAVEGLIWHSLWSGRVTFRKHQYWLPDGTQVSQSEWFHYIFGPEIDGCHDPAWEK